MTRTEAVSLARSLFPKATYIWTYEDPSEDGLSNVVNMICIQIDDEGVTFQKLEEVSKAFCTDKINLVPRQHGYSYSSWTYESSIPSTIEITL